MAGDIEYVHRKWRAVVAPLHIAAGLSAAYVLFALMAWLVGRPAPVQGDFFKFCLVVMAAYLPFYGFFRLARAVVVGALRSRSPEP